MKPKRTLLGTLISTFRFERDRVRREAIEDIWARNKLANPKVRGGYEIREHESCHDGTATIRVQLWKKVDEKVMVVSSKISSEEVGVEDVKDLMT